ncbi:hypothetical protein, partial [Escherichia coli]|uniref:hypothetical protein n=1 Tax=Escherichia coli TaxID=562 RepID=UPI003EE30512
RKRSALTGFLPRDRSRPAQYRGTGSGASAFSPSFQSPYNDQRSVIALLADSPRGYEMLNDAVNDSG